MTFKWIVVIVAGAIGLALLGAAPSDRPVSPGGPYPGIAKPSERPELTLEKMGLVWDVRVKPGDAVKAGQVLLVLDRREEEANLRIYELEANSEAVVKGAEVAWRAAQVSWQAKVEEFKRVEGGYKNRVQSIADYEKARLEADIAELEIAKSKADWDKAITENQQRKEQVEKQKVILDRMQIISPIDGIVEEVLLKKGEVVDPQKPVITVVNNDPLWVEVPLPLALTLKLKLGQELKVKYADVPDDPYHAAKVIFMNPEVSAGSRMRLVRLEMPNPEQYPSGAQVIVSLDPATAGGVVEGR
jgi:RND family efflux transporter MFP subunit